MKLQGLAIIFIILILPISIVIGEYASFQIETFRLERLYDSRLITATHDALKTFQINTFNDTTSDIVDSKTNIIEASANAFYNSMESGFGMQGYSKDDLKAYVPALVYTMYDGYYIYSPYTNIAQVVETTANPEDDSEKKENLIIDISEANENIEYGFKPYVYYSCRYNIDTDNDFIINYSLDNYITVQGIVKGQSVYKSGYLVTLASSRTAEGLCRVYNDDKGMYEYYYSGQKILPEGLKESVIDQIKDPTTGDITVTTKEYEFVKINGTKYYLGNDKDIDEDGKIDEYIFYLSGGVRKKQASKKDNEELYNKYVSHIKLNRSAINYYRSAYEFTNWVNENLGGLQIKDAEEVTNSGAPNDYIFENSKIEYSNSNFNLHRKEVIRHSIESNLSVAIANFNSYANAGVNFQMPRLKENEWDMLQNEISIISFLQGMKIGGKIYNGYTVVTNNKNEEFVGEENIYITANDEYYHKINDRNFANLTFDSSTVVEGVLDLDFEPRKDSVTGKSYVRKKGLGSYSSVVGQDDVNNEFDSIYEYLQETSQIDSNIKQIYYKALARERWGMFKVENSSNNQNILNEMSTSQDYRPITLEEEIINGKGIVTENLIRHYDGENIDGYTNDGNNSKVKQWVDLSGNFNGIMMDGVFADKIQTTTDGLMASSAGYVNFAGVSNHAADETTKMNEGDWVNLGQIKNLKEVTLEAVFSLNDSNREYTIPGQSRGVNYYLISNKNGNGGISLYVDKSGHICFSIYGTNKNESKTLAEQTIEPGNIYHVFAVYDGSKMLIYLKNKTTNQENVKEWEIGIEINNPTEDTVMALGVDPDGKDGTKTNWGWSNIKMYIARIYNKALTEAQIEQNIDQTKIGSNYSGESGEEPETPVVPEVPVIPETPAPSPELDNVGPTIEFSPNGNPTYKTSQSTTVTVSDAGSGVNTSMTTYEWVQGSEILEASYLARRNVLPNDGVVEIDYTVGIGNDWFLWVLAYDNEGNYTISRSNAFYVDTE